MTLYDRALGWKAWLVWRHRILWSYRLDIFVLLMMCYLLSSLLITPIFALATKRSLASFEEGNAQMDATILSLKPFMEIAQSRPLTDEESQEVEKINIIKPTDPSSRRLFESELIMRQLSGIQTLKEMSPGASALLAKYRDLLEVRQLTAIQVLSSYIFAGSEVLVLELLVVPLIIFLLAFHILNVFTSRETLVVSKHPTFILVMTLFMLIIIVPIAVGIGLETGSAGALSSFQGQGAALEKFGATIITQVPSQDPSSAPTILSVRSLFLNSLRDAALYVNQFRTIEIVMQDGQISDWMRVLVPFVAWIGCGLWAVRRFGGGPFLACSTVIVIVTVVLSFGLSAANIRPETMIPEGSIDLVLFSVRLPRFSSEAIMWALTIFASLGFFIYGLLAQSGKSYSLCAGFVGGVVGGIGLSSLLVQVHRSDLLGFIWLVIIIVSIGAVVEAILRRAMFEFLYEPR